MSPKQSLLALSVGLVSCTTGWGKSSLPAESHPFHSKLTNACPPPEFDLAKLAHAALGVEPQPKVKEMRVLAWEESAREVDVYLDQALLWIETESDGYVIAAVRSLHDDAPTWEAAEIEEKADQHAFPGTVTMAAAPTHDQFERFLNQSNWSWTGADNSTSTYPYTLLSSSVCADAWTKSFGEPPWHTFTLAPAAGSGSP